jgi:hypothetical protein
MKLKHILVVALFLFASSLRAQVVRVQFINNCPDLSLPGIDVYVDGILVQNDIFFRQATPFFDVTLTPSVPTEIGIADMISSQAIDTFLAKKITFDPAKIYTIVINGINSTSGYSPIPEVSLDIFDRTITGANVGETQIVFANGATDAPVMDIRTQLINMADDIAYKGFGASYTSLKTNRSYIFRLTNPAGNKTSHTYLADIPNYNIDGKAVTILTSGFINPAANSNGEPFGLWMALPEGGLLVPLDTSAEAEKLARIQLIHNSADTAVKLVDVYANGDKMISDFDFRHATPYMDAIADVSTDISIRKAGLNDEMYKKTLILDSGATYTAVFYGIHDSSKNYSPRPPLDLKTYAFAQEEAPTTTTASLLFMHSSTDCTLPDISPVPGSSFVTNMAYGQYTNYQHGIASPGAGNKYLLKVDTAGSSTFMNNYLLPFDNWNIGGKTMTIVTSGFIDTFNNSEGPKFGLWAAMPEGGAMKELPVDIAVHVNDITKHTTAISISPNPATDVITFTTEIPTTHTVITDITGKVMYQSKSTLNCIDIKTLASGTYTLLLQAENGALYYSKFSKL